MESILILHRGNSGSGKTTIARAVQHVFGEEAVLISQDVFRREIFCVKDTPNNLASGLMKEAVLYAKGKVPMILVEGIYSREKYQDFLDFLMKLFPQKKLVYYFDLSFEETVKRHQTRMQRDHFSEENMREWWLERDLLFPQESLKERLIKEGQTIAETVNQIMADYEEIRRRD
ncbi:AAA family ATPase [Enterococcus casseliflavus]|uniref:AAA family ATPase n=1 Tax=Enterococcus casseliflavus TaxID=37734 RepID=UPI00115CA885|nr:AAA family ATPase [Enterococcus casseliflavus]MEB6210367.1 AAA family ATPase [Enterococcus casseliflavus]